MTKEQNSFLQMFAAVKATTDAHTTAWTGFTSYATPYAAFVGLLPQADAALALQEKSSTGATDGKSDLRIALSAKLMQLTSTLVLYAQNVNNTILREDAQMTKSDMDKLSEKALVGHSIKLQSLVTPPIATAIAPMGITAAVLTSINTDTLAFNNLIGSPRHIIAESARGTEDLDRIITNAKRQLVLMDLAMDVLKYTQPAFYSEYETSRTLIDPSYNTRALEVTVKDTLNGEPLQGAAAIINPGNQTKTSGSQGMFYLNSLAPGSYEITVSKAGYKTETQNVVVDAEGGIQITIEMKLN
jgi:hypothetical protein